jgi:hypothetical protein
LRVAFGVASPELTFRDERAIAKDVLDPDSPLLKGARDEEPAVAVLRGLLGAHDGDSLAGPGAIDRAGDALPEHMRRGDEVITHPAIRSVERRVAWPAAQSVAREDVTDAIARQSPHQRLPVELRLKL